MRKRILTVVCSFIALAAFSQPKTGVITGSVKASATKSPLFEAVITVSSPVLEGKKFAITDSTGNYKIANLPKGTYSITIEMEGFDTINYDNIFLPEGMSQGVSVEMRREKKTQKAKEQHKSDIMNGYN